MMATSKKMLDQEPSEIEMLLPWHAAGTLNARDARRVEEALARDPELARQYAVIREEYAETIRSQRKPRRAVGARHAEAVRGDRRRAGAQAVGVAQYLGADRRIFRKPVAADAGLVGEPRRAGAVVAGRRDRRGAGEEPARLVPDRVVEHERARHPIVGSRKRRRARWCGSRRTRASPTSPRCSTAIRPRSSMAPRAACSGCSSATRRWRRIEIAGLMSRLQSEKIVSLAVATP